MSVNWFEHFGTGEKGFDDWFWVALQEKEFGLLLLGQFGKDREVQHALRIKMSKYEGAPELYIHLKAATFHQSTAISIQYWRPVV